jgi:tetratricopeptide (TPR) repeat protein
LAAEAAVKRALELDPNNAVAHAIYAEILIHKGEFGDIDIAIEESRLARNLGPDLLETHRARGYVLYWTGNYQEAVQEYRAALEINDKISNLYLRLAYSYYAMDEYDQAVEAFNQANALNPSDPTPDYEASRVYFAVGEYSRAVQYAEQAVKDEPSDAILQGNLGVMYAKNGEPAKAIERLALAVQGGTTDDGNIVEGLPLSYEIPIIELYSTYGLTLARQNRCAEAVPIFQAMLSVVPEDEIAVFNATEGLRICQESLETTPSEITPTPTP